MEYQVKSGTPEQQRTTCLVAAVFESKRLSPTAAALDKASGGKIAKLLRKGDLKGKPGETLLLHDLPGSAADRVLLVGCGAQNKLSDKQFREFVTAAIRAVGKTGATNALLCVTELDLKDRTAYWKIRRAVELCEGVVYRYDETKSERDKTRRPLRQITFPVSGRRDVAAGKEAVRQASAIAAGRNLARELGNLPANVCTPSYLADEGRKLARGNRKLKATVLDKAQMTKLGMGSLLSVARGSQEPPKLIVLEYNGGKKGDKPHVLVGKGITFDSGGISIKPAPAMDEMKFDMCGAASVLGTMKSVAQLELPLNVVGIVPACENLPSGTANKPGDVVTSMSGLTIEILNTDAEGRLILCDALTYAERYNPKSVVDIATLTGACVIALGGPASGLLSNHDPLAQKLLKAGEAAGDRAWQLPLWDEYQEALKSNFADIPNIAGREAGTITAACFLSRFTKKYHWAHLDIAGTAWLQGKEKGATGRPVGLLTQYLMEQSGIARK